MGTRAGVYTPRLLTAYEQHAVRAFEVYALDYLLKPIDDERFAAAIGRAREVFRSERKLHTAERLVQLLEHGASDSCHPFPGKSRDANSGGTY